MTHAKKVREVEGHVVELADAWEQYPHAWLEMLVAAIRELRALRAETCGTCGGTGKHEQRAAIGPVIVLSPCPAGCHEGRKP